MALLKIVTKGATDVSVFVRVVDSTDGTPETGVAFNTAGADLWYCREGAAHTSITEVTQTESGAHTDGGFVHISDGVCRLDLPDAAVASGVDSVEIGGTFTDMVVIGGTIQLTGADLQDNVRGGLSALPNVAAGSAGGLADDTDSNGRVRVVSGTGAGEVSLTSGRPASNVTHFGGTAGTFAAGIPEINLAQWRGTQPATLSNTYVQSSAQEIATALITASSIAADAIGASELAADGIAEIVADIMTEVVESEGSYTVQQALSIMLSVLAGETSSGGTTISTPNGVATRVAATTDASNNRTAMTITPSS